LFLDELADVSHSIQVRLLRAIEEKAVMRVGGDRIVPVDVRILASSYKDLAQAALLGTFRSDLYFRIATLKLNTIPLRERIEDIPILIESLLKRYSTPDMVSLLPLSKEVFSRMKNHPWLGNIRELDSLIQRFLALLSTNRFDAQKLVLEIMNELSNETSQLSNITNIEDANRNLKEQLRKYEMEIIEETLGMTENNKAKAAKILGISVNSLWRKLRNN
jgi:propionate catabolism operon transcriptional regulator